MSVLEARVRVEGCLTDLKTAEGFWVGQELREILCALGPFFCQFPDLLQHFEAAVVCLEKDSKDEKLRYVYINI